MRSSIRSGVTSGLAVCFAALAACGSPPPVAVPEAHPAPTSSATATPPPSASASVAAPPPTAAAPSSSASATPPPARAVDDGGRAPKPPVDNNVPIQASKLVAEAKRLGVDFVRPLSGMSLQQKKKVMPLFVKSLGYEGCTGCHIEGDFEKETHNINVARQMWDHFVVGLRDAQGAPLFCDSCHGGRARSLDRADMDTLKKVMETDYQGKLTRADKKPHDCSGCHGDPPELKVIEKVWGIAAK